MVFGFFEKKQLLEEDNIIWMFDTYAWALRNFNANVFFNETILVTPSNKHFPGEENTAEGMANIIFEQVKRYAGMTHWPTRLVNDADIVSLPKPQIEIKGALRGSKGEISVPDDDSQRITVTYNEFQLNDPEVLIATYAHALAHYLSTTTKDAPPGGIDNWAFATELLAVFLGFGVIMANSANTSKIRSCGSCSGPAIERTNFLTQFDTTYALAIFCHLKQIPSSDVTPMLKKSLRSFYKNAVKDIASRTKETQALATFTNALN